MIPKKREKVNRGDVSPIRLRSLRDLEQRYHGTYERIGSLSPRERDREMKEIVEVYIPNVMRDFPNLIDKIDTLTENLKERDAKIIQLNKERKQAFKKLGWPICDFADLSDYVPELDEDDDED